MLMVGAAIFDLPLPAEPRRCCRVAVALAALVLACVVGSAHPAGAAAEQASEPSSPAAGLLDAGGFHSCAVLVAGTVRCWGLGLSGQLGYGNGETIGDDETPASVGPVNLGTGRTVWKIAAGDYHTCAILDDRSVRCWGFGGNGRLGYGNPNNVSDPSAVGPVNLGAGHTARAITAGSAHTCAILDDGSVRCWGFGGNGQQFGDGRLGYGNTNNVGDKPTTTPDLAGAVNIGTGHTAMAISAGGAHTCAILDDGNVRCWGDGEYGQLGYGNTNSIGGVSPPAPGEATTPDTAGPVQLGTGHRAVAISAGGLHTCALLEDGSVRCWGFDASGQLGYGNTNNVGDTPTTTPDMVGPVNLGVHRAVAISAGDADSCTVLDDASVRCWGDGAYGRLGYANTSNAGDTPITTPDKVGPVNLGAGHTATAISAGAAHTCARLDDASVRCWGYGVYGQLGYCSRDSIGDNETPGSVGPVNLQPGDGGAGCASPTGTPGGAAPGGGGSGAAVGGQGGTPVGRAPSGAHHPVDPLAVEAARAKALRNCLAAAAHRPKRQRSRAGKDCLTRYGRTPGRVTALTARAVSGTTVVLSFPAVGSDGTHPPAAHGYLVKQSRHPIHSARDFRRAQTLCRGYCRFSATAVGARITLTITHLQPHSTYYYALTARDNVSGRPGPRSPTAWTRTR